VCIYWQLTWKFCFPDFTIVIVDEAKDTVVAAGSVIVERKFVHLNGLVGHIEDIAVDGNQQGKKFGIKIIEALKYIGEHTGCYKGEDSESARAILIDSC
jgi:GNAT superfamily N-acetyltransferase